MMGGGDYRTLAALLPVDVAIKAALEREAGKEVISSSFDFLRLVISIRNIEDVALVLLGQMLVITDVPFGW